MTPEERKKKYHDAAILRWERKRARGETKRSKEHTDKIVAANTGKKRDPDVIEKMREAARQSWIKRKCKN